MHRSFRRGRHIECQGVCSRFRERYEGFFRASLASKGAVTLFGQNILTGGAPQLCELAMSLEFLLFVSIVCSSRRTWCCSTEFRVQVWAWNFPPQREKTLHPTCYQYTVLDQVV